MIAQKKTSKEGKPSLHGMNASEDEMVAHKVDGSPKRSVTVLWGRAILDIVMRSCRYN